MKTPSQKSVWDKIAPEWYEFKTKPAEHTLEFLKDKTGNVLDLGSGAGRHLIKIKKGKMYLADFSKKMIEFAKKRAEEKKIPAEFFVADLTKLPFENNFFDSAICIALLHCVEGESTRKKVIEELFRVLKPGAEAEIAVWNKDSKKFKNSPKEKYVKWRDKGARYYYLYDEKEIHELFKSIGFKIKKRFVPQRNIIFIAEKPKIKKTQSL
jgi:ubiquinone/menaquinone biosynthesis C-methylase UbiE